MSSMEYPRTLTLTGESLAAIVRQERLAALRDAATALRQLDPLAHVAECLIELHRMIQQEIRAGVVAAQERKEETRALAD